MGQQIEPIYRRSNTDRQSLRKKTQSNTPILIQQEIKESKETFLEIESSTKNTFITHKLERAKPTEQHEINTKTQQTTYIKEHLSKACEEMKKTNFNDFQDTYSIYQTRWLISKEFKLMACKNFKVGTTNIARVLYTLDHLSENKDSNRVEKIRARVSALIKKKETENLDSDIKSFTKFMFVRDPIERLLSAFRNQRPRYVFEHNENQISFGNYLEWLVSVSDNEANSHVVSFTRMCNPCRINYDIIGLLDNFETDMQSILRLVGAETLVALPQRNQTGYKQDKSSDVLQAYLKHVPKHIIQKIYDKYYWDFFLFGFPKPDF